jgi:hypothetical protein
MANPRKSQSLLIAPPQVFRPVRTRRLGQGLGEVEPRVSGSGLVLLLGAIWGSMQPIGIPMESHLITRTHAASAWLAQAGYSTVKGKGGLAADAVASSTSIENELFLEQQVSGVRISSLYTASLGTFRPQASSRPMHALLCPVRERVDRYIADVISLGAAQSLAMHHASPHVAYV